MDDMSPAGSFSSIYRLSDIEIHQEPFLHFLIQHMFEPAIRQRFLDWFEEHAPWQASISDFYQVYKCNLMDVSLPDDIGQDFFDQTRIQLKQCIEEYFSTKLEDRLTVVAHKVLPGQKVGIHNDAPQNGTETHRLVVQINRSWSEENGGYLLFFNSANSRDIAHIYPPLDNTAVGFALSPHSYHAVSKVEKGTRYSLIYSFWQK